MSSFFFFNDTATTEIYTLSLHDALPILAALEQNRGEPLAAVVMAGLELRSEDTPAAMEWLEAALDKEDRSEEHTSELQSHLNLVCRLLLEKKKNLQITTMR